MSSQPRWPDGLTPESAVVYTHNELTTTVSADALWATLIRATEWPSWYSEAANVRTQDGEPTLHLGSIFTWRTLNTRVRSEVTVFVPVRAIAWKASGSLSHGFHRFDFEPSADGRCTITTEEVESGIGPRLIPRRLANDLTRAHQVWLEALVKRSME